MKRFIFILAVSVLLSGCVKKQECRIDYDDVNQSVVYSVGYGSFKIERFDDERKAGIFLKYLERKYKVTR